MRTSIVELRDMSAGLASSRLATRLFRRGIDSLLDSVTGGQITFIDHTGRISRHGVAGGPEASITVTSPDFYRSAVLGGSVGAARSYMRGEWHSDDLVDLFRIFARDRGSTDRLEGGIAAAQTLAYRVTHWLRRNTRANSKRNIEAHYDLGNDFFEAFLDESMTYSSGIFEAAGASLEQAQAAKNDRLCAKLRLSPDDHLVEIGTGWGALAIHAASRYGCRVTTTTLSREQAALARERVHAAGLTDRVEVLERDYRDLPGAYDKLVSVEMIEAVGHQKLGDYFAACDSLLREDGTMAIQAITVRDQRYEIARTQVDVIQALLFPGADIPSMTAMLDASTSSSELNLFHVEDITSHYARTCREWRDRFHENTARVRELGATAEFTRLWHYYLCYCEAGFTERYTGCVQMLFAKPGARPTPPLPRLEQAS